MPPNVVAGFKAGQGDAAGGIGFQQETAPTIGGTASGSNQVPAVLDARGNGDGNIAPTLTGDHGNRVTDYTALAVDSLTPWDVQSERVITPDAIAPTMSGCEGKGGRNPVGLMLQHSIVRRLTTLECERLQGYPDGWTDIPEITGITDEGYELFKQLLFDAAVREGTARQNPAAGTWQTWSKQCYKVRRGGEVQYRGAVWKNTRKPYQHKTKTQMVKYINNLKSDSAIYKGLGNSIALPPWRWLCQQIRSRHDTSLTMGSLFDGIGGFPLIWEEINGSGACRWASEIEPFCVAVTMTRFPENRAGTNAGGEA